MSKKIENKVEEAIFDFIRLPFIVIVGIYIVSALLDALLGTNATFPKIFVLLGGIGLIANYYKNLFKKWGWIK